MIILDFHGCFVRHTHTILKNPEDLTLHNVRCCIYSGILQWRKKYFNEYGEIVLAFDNTSGFGNGYWRRDIYKYYKINRAKNREESVFDWAKFFGYFDQVKLELKEYFPYKILDIPKCEADELIYLELENRPDNERSLIISADKDLKQCQRLPNVRQWSYMTKKFLDEKYPLKYIIEHTIRGDSGDGVPNIFSPDDTFVNVNIRQKSINTKDIMRWGNLPIESIQFELAEKLVVKPTKKRPLEITFNEALKTIKRNWLRNTQMVDLSKTPKEFKDKLKQLPIVEDRAVKVAGLYSYFVKNELINFVHETDNFVGDGTKKQLSFKELLAAKKSRISV